MYFDTKSYLNSTRNHTAKHAQIYLIRVHLGLYLEFVFYL
jgi:hypothetical protein